MINKISFKPISNTIYKKLDNNSTINLISQKNTVFLSPCGINGKNDIEIQQTNDTKRYYEFLNRKGKVTKEEYFDIKKKNPQIISKARIYTEKMMEEKDIYTTPELSAKIISGLVHYKDSKHKIISIGTSPSFLTEGLKEIGVDVVFVPISNGSNCKGQDTMRDYYECYPNLKHVANYIKSKGITGEKIGRDETLVLLDYKSTGRTIHLIKRILLEDCNIPEENIRVTYLNNFIDSGLLNSKNHERKKDDRENVFMNTIMDIFEQRVESMANVAHFSVYRDYFNKRNSTYITSKNKSEEQLFREFEEFSRPEARAYQLCVLNELDKAGVLK